VAFEKLLFITEGITLGGIVAGLLVLDVVTRIRAKKIRSKNNSQD